MEADFSRYRLLDVEVNALTIRDLNALIKAAIEKEEQRIIANHNLHSVYLYHRTPKMQALYSRSDYVHIDGMSLIYLGQLLGLPLKRRHRVTYVDWIHPLLQTISKKQRSLFYLGARPQVVTTGTKRIREEYPNLELEYHHGYFDRTPGSSGNQSVIADINAFDPDVLMVGMGMPRQEKWIIDNIHQIEAHVVLPSGACIDYIAGATPVPPRWMGKLGLEWFYRLLQEPRRLWRRNFVEPWPILERFIKELVQRRVL
jgi:N-acetylglucosaminyldiphosphoundecaprenol N-acetyl-beta-D-mannosaminyltransferase